MHFLFSQCLCNLTLHLQRLLEELIESLSESLSDSADGWQNLSQQLPFLSLLLVTEQHNKK